MMVVSRFTAALFLLVTAAACASAPPRVVTPVGLTGLPAEITVSDWPYWVDIPIESKDYDRTWRTVIDIVSERAAIGVLDKESGYIRTEWRPVDVNVGLYTGMRDERGRPVVTNQTGEQRYTFRIRQSESKIRMGIESRLMPSQRWASGLRNIPNAPWVGIHNELRDRLTTP